ncbi:MAG TPA: FtsK/SpoIIIE domain-containing protein [Verrucomicrobiae bacterium]
MSSILSATKTIQALESLRGAIEEITARAEKLNEEWRSQTAREQRRYEAALEEQTSALASALREAETQYELAKAAAKSGFERRKAWLGRAFQSSKELGLQRVEDRIGARKYELQKRLLQAERDQQNGLAAATAAFEQFRNTLASEQQALALVERAAQGAFKGHPSFQRLFRSAYETADSEVAGDEHRLLKELQDLVARAAEQMGLFRGSLLLRIVRYPVAWIAVAGGLIAAVPLLRHLQVDAISYARAGIASGSVVMLVLILRFFATRNARPFAVSASKTLALARRVHNACEQQSEAHYHQNLERLNGGYAASTEGVDQELKQTLARAGDMRVACRMKNDERAVRANKRNERNHQARLERLGRGSDENVLRLKQAAEVRAKALAEAWEEQRRRLTEAHTRQFKELQGEWETRLKPLYESLDASIREAAQLFPPWEAQCWREWRPPATSSRAAAFGSVEVALGMLCGKDWKARGLALPGPDRFVVPLCLAYPEAGSLLIETDSNWGHGQAVGALNNVILRLLSTAPPGKLNFTILDPVGLGQNFAGVMHLADYEEQMINNRIWTQSTQIEEKLAELNEHMEKVIQMYLRNEYQTIAEYNERAGVIAEKYHFLVVADFPANFTDVAAKRLLSIAASGARCGVFTLIHWDRRQAMPQDFIPDELRKSSFGVKTKGTSFVLAGDTLPGVDLIIDEPPSPEMATGFIHEVGRLSRDSGRVEVPFAQVAPADSEIWTEDTTQELRVAIGRTGATKLQYLEMGRGTCQHALLAGKTGSGKSTLFHVMITNLALWCSPEQVEFYLVDFKKGVEFKCYASRRLPHARVVAIESDREFGLSVLQRVDDELRRRGDLFRHLGVQDIPGYKRAGGKEAIPRTLLMVDEFQEFFVEDDKVSQTASLLLDRIVRQGRAFGIHVLLGSQTLGGAYTVARTTLGQMVIRIALQCNEADAFLIMDENNPAPRLLSRPGEGIYNDMAGTLEGNSPFQVVWLPEEVRDDWLGKVRARADSLGELYPGPIVFEGNAPADVRENALLRHTLESRPERAPAAGRIWLGAPNSIKGPTEVVFRRQSGSHLLIVGQRDEAMLGMLALGLIALAAEYPAGQARFVLVDATPPGTPQRALLDKVCELIPHGVELPRQPGFAGLMKEFGSEMKRRREAVDPDAAGPVFLLVNGLQKFNKLRYEEDFGFSSSGDAEGEVNPAAVLNEVICEGARLGLHVIATCDTYNNVSRFLSRKALSEFEMRVLFQMSANDSASLIDNPKAGILGLHRALYYNAQEGYLETFRPYALPRNDWVDEAGERLARVSKDAVG